MHSLNSLIYEHKPILIEKLIGIGFSRQDAIAFIPYLAQFYNDTIRSSKENELGLISRLTSQVTLNENRHLLNFSIATNLSTTQIEDGANAITPTLLEKFSGIDSGSLFDLVGKELSSLSCDNIKCT